ncbi:GNAT family N-acetyltransferase [Rossellomorea aquimaris]|uniref:GNAT family N-acetyltransferase n=1 Tax=Rossellomorea aquimaris TaxID=189382 RepID=UPI001CD5144A|nr:GNAT family N-acetyltransferase [Rossellomorea aquimaris]MCA1053765.1 GNAT family N-acetyltransferase [Rossellomorea aquimaris]
MKNIGWGSLSDLEDLVDIDKRVIGSEQRRDVILESITCRQCLVYKIEGEAAGFLLFHDHFFNQLFVSLVIVHPQYRNKGVAKELFRAIEHEMGDKKIFSSTNQSNALMHHLFHSIGYVKNGYIEELDEGDPEIIYVKKIQQRHLILNELKGEMR